MDPGYRRCSIDEHTFRTVEIGLVSDTDNDRGSPPSLVSGAVDDYILQYVRDGRPRRPGRLPLRLGRRAGASTAPTNARFEAVAERLRPSEAAVGRSDGYAAVRSVRRLSGLSAMAPSAAT